ncbi:U2-type spliceosomal complex subunit [Pichia kluyveri]|uniref:Pre-mRNA-splicing factor CWC21 n=1 Tax=Pichia kluyveri TaxID=36015 RepID=A0AAV5RA17_PICKL|nr:U2-type spliceosomal complex subunit [Pichia kluyveri]
MSYNGIGLKSAKGSSTSGYIQRNLGDIRVSKQGENEGKKYKQRQLNTIKRGKVEKDIKRNTSNNKQLIENDKELIKHEIRKRNEIKIMEFRDKIEEDNPELDDDKIDEMVNEYREKLNKSSYNASINPFKK